MLRWSKAVSRAIPRVGSVSSASSHIHKAALTTYSGGQPSEGQGGFYGSAKTRTEDPPFKPGSRAEEEDRDRLAKLMQEWEASGHEKETAEQEAASWKEMVQDKENAELINRLVVKGAPVWGLSVREREFVQRFISTLH